MPVVYDDGTPVGPADQYPKKTDSNTFGNGYQNNYNNNCGSNSAQRNAYGANYQPQPPPQPQYQPQFQAHPQPQARAVPQLQPQPQIQAPNGRRPGNNKQSPRNQIVPNNRPTNNRQNQLMVPGQNRQQPSNLGERPSGRAAKPDELTPAEKVEYLRQCFPEASMSELITALKNNNGELDRVYSALLLAQVAAAAERPECKNMMAESVAFAQQYRPPERPQRENVKPANVNDVNSAKRKPCDRPKLEAAPFVSTVPDMVVQRTGKKKALLIGINYYGSNKELNGCVQDVGRIKKLVSNVYGFLEDPRFMRVLTDEPNNPMQPTRKNIMESISWLIEDTQAGDALFFSFSGHGAQKRDLSGTEVDGFDETIMPVDYKKNGQITDDEIFKVMIRPLASGVKLTAFMDCCHSGSGLDLEFIFDLQINNWRRELYPKHTAGDVLLISGCRDDQTSADILIPSWGAGGALTLALIQTLSRNPTGWSLKDLLQHLCSFLASKGFTQVPQLSSSQKVSPNLKFNMTTAVANMNPFVGMPEKKHKPPRAAVDRYEPPPTTSPAALVTEGAKYLLNNKNINRWLNGTE